jgi:hypothetical protein
MAESFDIRFARSGGIAALFDAAENSLGWKGDGLLRIDAQGMNFALKRGFASLLARRRSQHVPAQSIKEVYREGETVRVEFATRDNPRVVLPFWARNREDASQIVQLLPTLRTFEVEHTPAESAQKTRRSSWTGAAAVVLVLAAAAWIIDMKRPTENAPVRTEVIPTPPTSQPLLEPRSEAEPVIEAATDEAPTPEQARRAAIVYGTPDVDPDTPVASTPTPGAARLPLARVTAAVEAEPDAEAFVPMDVPEIELRPEQTVVRIPQTTLAYATARDMLRAFEVAAGGLVERYRRDRADFDRGLLDAHTFANRLDTDELRWRGLSEATLADRKYADAALAGMRATLLMAVIQQRVFLSGYAAGLRAGDAARIDRAFKDLALADEALARARLYVN